MKIPEEIVRTAKGAMLQFGTHPPTVFVHGTKRNAWFTLTMPEAYPERIKTMRNAGMAVAQWGKLGELVQVIYVCEAWASPAREPFVRPAEDPNRSEVLLINALEAATLTQSLEMYTCVRDEQDAVVELKPMPGDKPGAVSGELLPSFVAGFQSLKRR